MPTRTAFRRLGLACWIAIGPCVALAGCSSIEDAAPAASQVAPDISKAFPVIKTTAGQYHLAEPLEVAGPIEAPIGSINPWVICLKSAAEARFTVALFYKADGTLASSHISTMGDGCDGQTYHQIPN